MLRSIIRIMLAAMLLFLSVLSATAAQDEVFLAKMKVVREIDLGGVVEYEMEC